MYHHRLLFILLPALAAAALSACGSEAETAGEPEVAFQITTISDSADYWWARSIVDLSGDGIKDIALQDDNAHGGWLGWLEGKTSDGPWTPHIIAEIAPGAQTFASGDLDAGDLDNDGDIDVLAFAHPGEWDDAQAPTRIYWAENPGDGPGWAFHPIGTSPDFVKDVNLADFNSDGLLDLVTITYEEHSLNIFRQDGPNDWAAVQEVMIDSLHEGMDVGDLDGDGDIDIATNGYWLENPGGDLTQEWVIRSIDERWHNQGGDWSRNATKVATYDIDGDARAEVFIAHSERQEYPLSWYGCPDSGCTSWDAHVVRENWPAGHSMQVFDADLDGDADILAGPNRGRAEALGETSFPMTLFLNAGDNQTWIEQVLTEEGVYNAQASDIDGDGDVDLLRLPSHDATILEVWWNQTRQ